MRSLSARADSSTSDGARLPAPAGKRAPVNMACWMPVLGAAWHLTLEPGRNRGLGVAGPGAGNLADLPGQGAAGGLPS